MRKTVTTRLWFALLFCAAMLLALAGPAAAATYNDQYGTWTYTISNGEATITKYDGTGGYVTIPSTVVAIEAGAFGTP